MDRRNERRITAAFSVRIWGVDAKDLPFAQHARVRNFSGKGATVEGLSRPVRPGRILNVQFGDRQARFVVMWAGKVGTRREGEIGLESLPTEPYIWDVNFERCSACAGEG